MDHSLSEIGSVLRRLRNGEVLTPFPGRWITPAPKDERRVVIAVDDTIGEVQVDLLDGVVQIASGAQEQVVSSSLAAFVASAEAYDDALRRAADIDPDDDDAFERLEKRLLRRLHTADPLALAEADGFWVVAAEEIGLGAAAHPTSPPPETPPDGVSAQMVSVMIALTDEDRDRLFTADEWQQLTSIADVTIVRSPRMIAVAVEIAEQQATARGKKPVRASVLVVPAASLVDSAVEAALPGLRLVCVTGDLAGSPLGGGIRVTQTPTGADIVATVSTQIEQ